MFRIAVKVRSIILYVYLLPDPFDIETAAIETSSRLFHQSGNVKCDCAKAIRPSKPCLVNSRFAIQYDQ